MSEHFRPVGSAKKKRSLRDELGLPTGRKLLLYAGRLSVQKNVLSLLSVLEANPRLSLLICGEPDFLDLAHLKSPRREHVPSQLTREILKRKLYERVTFRPNLDQDRLRKVMQACDAQSSLSAHFGEDFGISITQGLCCGLPTILSDWGGHRNWLEVERSSIRYVPLQWSEEREIGFPDVAEIRIPAQPPIHFRRNFRAELRRQMNELVFPQTEVTASAEILISKELIGYWKNQSRKPTPYLFDSAKHPLFRKVVAAYSGRDMG